MSGDFGRQVSLDRIWHVDELVLDREALGDELPEPADAERLGRVVAAGQEVDPVLARFAHHRFAGLAGDQGVQPERARLMQGEAARARDDPDGGDPIGAGSKTSGSWPTA